VALVAKRACWTDWRLQYERGQDPNRITYVAERLRVLDAATVQGASTAPAVATAGSVGCPLPDSPYAPPPPVATSGVTISVNAAPPDVTCSEACNREWKSCSPVCSGNVDCLGT